MAAGRADYCLQGRWQTLREGYVVIYRPGEPLITLGLSVTEIAALWGCDNPLYFSRAFSRHFQLSPTAYQRAIGINAGRGCSHNRKTAQMTLALARFMRASFQWDTPVSLGDEGLLVQEYLKLYRIRYESRLDALTDYRAEDGNLLMPK